MISSTEEKEFSSINIHSDPSNVPKNKDYSTTRYGVFATNLAVYSGTFYAVAGFVLILWGAFYNASEPYYPYFTGRDVLIALWAMLFGSLIVIYEFKTHRNERIPRTNLKIGIVQLIILIPGFICFPTTFASACLLFPALLNIYCYYIGELYPGVPPKKASATKVQDETMSMRFYLFIAGRNPEGRRGRMVFLTLYFIANLTVGFVHFANTWTAIRSGDIPRWTGWVPWAKFFGNVMNLNFTILFIPVSRNLVRWLYNNSTADQSFSSMVLKKILIYIPLDQAHKMHRLCGWVGFVAAVLHTFCHLMNFVQLPGLVWSYFGFGIWFTGVMLVVIMLFLYAGTHDNLKRTHFEIFWATHMTFPVFILMNLLHGKGWWGPNFWKWLLAPGIIYLIERIWRTYTSMQDVSLLGVTFMSNNVMSLKIAKSGALANYREGQYAYLCCPHISAYEWHPMTISSAPQDAAVTFHIRVQGPGSWTYRMQQYMALFTKIGASYHEFHHNEDSQSKPGKIKGPDGLQLLRVYGPHSAPTQRLTEYNEALICTSGIGVTPLAAAMSSIVLYRWRMFMGKTFPDKVHFFWVTSYKELQSFRWFVRCVKEIEDALAHMKKNNSEEMKNKHFSFVIHVTSYEKDNYDTSFNDVQDKKLTEEEDLRFWGTRRLNSQNGIQFADGPFTEAQLYKAMLCPPSNGNPITLGHVTVKHGRPNWREYFSKVASTTQEENVGVLFCGNPGIGKDLTAMSVEHSTDKLTFHTHKEVF